jgi:hypothetical protein
LRSMVWQDPVKRVVIRKNPEKRLTRSPVRRQGWVLVDLTQRELRNVGVARL